MFLRPVLQIGSTSMHDGLRRVKDVSKILEILLPDQIQPAPIRFLRVEMAAGHITPFALVRYALDGAEQELGLRLDLDKRAFLDHFDRQDIESACRDTAPRIVNYLGSTPTASSALPNGDRHGRNADWSDVRPGGADNWKLSAVWRHLGVGTKRFLVACAVYLKDHPSFTFAELAQSPGSEQDDGSLRSSHRNLHRAIKAERAADPFITTLDGGIKRYQLPHEARQIIVELAASDQSLATP
jgi:hypothetical protein